MQDNNNKSVLNGIGLMIIATVLFSVMHASIKYMSSVRLELVYVDV